MRTRCCLPIVIPSIVVAEVAPKPNMRAEYATSRRSNVADAQPESGLDSFALGNDLQVDSVSGRSSRQD